MVDVKTAVQNAIAYAKDLFSEQELRHLRLEEVELADSEGTWKITLGWVEPAVAQHNVVLSGLAGSIQKLPRVYKVFHIDVDDGTVKAMKIRTVEE